MRKMLLKVGRYVYEITVKDKKDTPIKTSKKSYYNKNTNSDMKEILVTFSKALNPLRDRKAYDRAKKKYKREKEKFRKRMADHLNKLIKGEYTPNQFKHHARKEFKKMYYKAFELGAESTGLNLDYFKLPDEDYRWLDKIRKAEYKYLEKFIDDVVNQRGKMDYHARMDMYVDAIDGVFDAGRVDAMPSAGTKIWWRLSPAEHCSDCLDLAGRSPYTPETLPTTPRSGDTKCLSNCKCTLRITYKTPDYVDLEIKRYNQARGYEGIDWNVIDRLMSIIMEEQLMKPRKPEILIQNTKYLTEEYNKVIDKLNIDIDPDSRDFVLLHRLGAMIREQQLEKGGI